MRGQFHKSASLHLRNLPLYPLHKHLRGLQHKCRQCGEEKSPGPSLHTYLLTHSLAYLLTQELSSSRGALNCAATQELLSNLRNPKVQYRVNKSLPLVPILSHTNPVHTIPSYFSKIHFNIVHPFTSWSSKWFLSLLLLPGMEVRLFIQ
jgi:hypothetical protein